MHELNPQNRTVRRRLRPVAIVALTAFLLAPLLATSPAMAQAPGDNEGVHRLYCAYFLRQPDGGGLKYWSDLNDDGVSLEVIASNFALSDEFRNTYGKQVSTEAFVTLIYRNLFERTPDPDGFGYWVDTINGGVDRGIVMTYFSESQEYKNRLAQVGCSGSGGSGGTGSGGTNPGGTPIVGNTDPAVAARLAGATGWATPTLASSDDRPLRTMTSAPTVAGGTRTTTTCRPQGLPPLSRSFTEFPAYAFSGPTLPGLIVEGSGIEQGDLRVVPLDRSAVKLVSSSTIDNPVRNLASPDTSSVSTAVNSLKLAADQRLIGLDVTESDIVFTREEVHSYEESSLKAGVSLRYKNLAGNADFRSDFKQTSARKEHSIVVRFVQPMFSIQMERDGYVNPEDYFAKAVTADEIRNLEAAGKIGADNPPVLIDSVTYGRIMMFTMTSTTATSASELKVAVSGAYKGIEGEADLNDRQRSLLRTSTIDMAAYGGEQSLALAAIRSGRLSDFFGPANTANASPLTMNMRTLSGQKIDVADEATLQQIACTDAFAPYLVRVEVRDLYHANANVLINGKRVNANVIKPPNKQGQAFGLNVGFNQYLKPGWNDIEFQLRNGTCFWLPDNEKIKAFVYTRGSTGEAWGGASWTKKFDGTACHFEWKMQVNTTTGATRSR